MDSIAQQLDEVRRKIARLLSAYPSAAASEQEEILSECEYLGGEVQELVGVLKLHIRQIVAATCALHEEDSAEAEHLVQIARHGIRVAHCAGEEVSAAVRLIRQLRARQPTSDG